MMPNKHILDHADGAAAASSAGEGGYAFSMLWQEITNGLGVIMGNATSMVQAVQKTKQLRDLLDIGERLNWSNSVLSQRQSNAGFYAVAAILLIILGCGLFYTINNKKK